MSRRHHFRPASVYLGLSVLLLILFLVMGCASKEGGVTPGPAPVVGEDPVRALEQAENLFKAAGGLDKPSPGVLSAASRQKYQEAVGLIEKDVLGRVQRDDLKMNAYGILAISQWRLGNYARALEAGSKGRLLYESKNLSTNRREYGMCLIVGGLCVASETYQKFVNLQAPPTPAQRRDFAARLQQAMQSIDTINTNPKLDPRDDIVVYANQWQLGIVDEAVRIWASEGLAREVFKPEVCRWLDRAEPVFAKFPASPYPQENTTLAYKNKFERRRRAYCQGQ